LGIKTRGINKPSTKKAGFLRPSPFHLHKQAEIRRCRALRRRRGAPERRPELGATAARRGGEAEAAEEVGVEAGTLAVSGEAGASGDPRSATH